MKGLHWWTLLIGYLIGSFFGVMSVLGFITGIMQPKKATTPATA